MSEWNQPALGPTRVWALPDGRVAVPVEHIGQTWLIIDQAGTVRVALGDLAVDAVEITHRVMADQRAQVSIECPRCRRVSHHPVDVAEGYCGACHDWTSPSRTGGDDPGDARG